MKIIRVEEAVGSVLCHDITRIIPGKFKGRAFKKGHIISIEDIPELLKLGKEHIYVWERKEGYLHENEAALRIAKAAVGEGITLSEPQEGKVSLVAEWDGMFHIDEDMLIDANSIEHIVVATRNHRRLVKKGDIVAGIRVVPLTIEQEKIEQVEAICSKGSMINIKPLHSYSVGIVTTGSEIYHGRIKDKFGAVIKRKMELYGCKVLEQVFVPDDADLISEAIKTLVAKGADLITVTGGMSVDPDDVTPSGIRNTGAEIITYGAPVLPGAMMLVSYLGDIPVLGLPGCVMYAKTTIFDLVMPMVLIGEKITKKTVVKLGMGGLCLQCKECHYPNCTFGTGA
ncbi:MAG: molybdopterin-binding protein [Desulfitobacteriaceae bacterium]|nr:molybdopterin-binding protein [Desulfitobacteriaceae bacterium]MDD4752169.1 molybdopterin-binding protein [Desulfitobacteriaceae bacterium]